MNTQTTTKNVEPKRKYACLYCASTENLRPNIVRFVLEFPFIKKNYISYIQIAWERTKGAKISQSFDLISNTYLDLQDFPRTPFSHCPWCTLFVHPQKLCTQNMYIIYIFCSDYLEVLPRRKETIVMQNWGGRGVNKVHH